MIEITKIILQDRKGFCWIVIPPRNSHVEELLECIKQQFYPKEEEKK